MKRVAEGKDWRKIFQINKHYQQMTFRQITIVFILLSIISSCKPMQYMGFDIQPSDTKDKIAKPYIHVFPESLGPVSDYEHIFTDKQLVELEKMLIDYEQQTTREIAIITINSIEPYPNISDYTTALANTWGIGKAETDNGLVILFSTELREIRISTGTGTGKILTDQICKNIIDQIITPQFKNDNYFGGIRTGLFALFQVWE